MDVRSIGSVLLMACATPQDVDVLKMVSARQAGCPDHHLTVPVLISDIRRLHYASLVVGAEKGWGTKVPRTETRLNPPRWPDVAFVRVTPGRQRWPWSGLAQVVEVQQRSPTARELQRRLLQLLPVADSHFEEVSRVEERLDDGPRNLEPPPVVLRLELPCSAVLHNPHERLVECSRRRKRLEGGNDR